jgi:hypothetical protein
LESIIVDFHIVISAEAQLLELELGTKSLVLGRGARKKETLFDQK